MSQPRGGKGFASQAQHLLDPATGHPTMPPLQRAALHQHLTSLDTLIAEITDNPPDPDGAPT